MKNNKRFIYKFAAVILICIISAVFSLSVGAESTFSSYTYSYKGEELLSPDAYSFYSYVTGGASAFNTPNDICTDEYGNIFVADTKNNRVVCLDASFNVKHIINSFDSNGVSDSLGEPEGVFAADGFIYIADTAKQRIVKVSALDYKVINVFNKPDTPLLENYIYNPSKLAVDSTGRIYTIAKNINLGVIVLDSDGKFNSFYGAKKVIPSISDLFWRIFMTKQQKASSEKFVPTTYNNLCIDDIGFVYVTNDSFEDWQLRDYIKMRGTGSEYAPVSRLNTVGNDVLIRDGFFPPAGEVNFELGSASTDGPSHIVDVALLENGSYCLLDSSRGRIFAYDENGNLLYAFGGKGTQNGLVGSASAMAAYKNRLYVLDAVNNRIAVYEQTDYGALLNKAISLQKNRRYGESSACWEEVLDQNANFNYAWSAMGQNCLMNEQYDKALECYRHYPDTENYSAAYAAVRKVHLRKWGGLIIFGIFVIIMCLVFAGKTITEYNKRPQPQGKPRTFTQKLLYYRHIIFHPFDGFYDMRHEGRGGVSAATLILAITVISFVLKAMFTGTVFKSSASENEIVFAVLTVLLPLGLYCASNWCLTTLMDGEGRFRDIYMGVCYSLVPMAAANILYTVASNFLTLEEGAILSLVISVMYGWSFLLIFISCMTVHRYSLLRNVLMIFLTIAGMAVMLFIGLLFFNVIQKMVAFIASLWNEWTFRL